MATPQGMQARPPAQQLRVSLGQHSDRGRKPSNQDFHGAMVPQEPLLSAKGVCLAVADGISTSTVSCAASESAIKSFLQDYYCTSEAWSVKTAGERVLRAANSWLHAQTRQSEFRYDKDRGYVCTFTALILKSGTAHILHVGDARAYRVSGRALEQLTTDHRLNLSADRTYLSRALGVEPDVDVDYRAVPLSRGATFLLMTDGAYEHVDDSFVIDVLERDAADLDRAAQSIVSAALAAGSSDNLTVQVVRVDELPSGQSPVDLFSPMSELPLPPLLAPGQHLDGYEILRALHSSHRSHVYLALDSETRESVALKIPSLDLRTDPAALERFYMEDWVARRIRSGHVLQPQGQHRRRSHAYLVSEYVDGQSLSQWMRDHPRPDVEAVRGLVEQIAKGLQAFHRQDMLHQDLRPENILIDASGTVKIIDFGAVRMAGMAEIEGPISQPHLLGTAQYTAPEYFLGDAGTRASDVFSLGVIAYQLLSGQLPYGAGVAHARSVVAQRRLRYESVLAADRDIPAFVDDALRRAVHLDPRRRYAELSEFVYDLRHPSRTFLARSRPPLIERNPVAFWKGVALLLALGLIAALWRSCGTGAHGAAVEHARRAPTRGGAGAPLAHRSPAPSARSSTRPRSCRLRSAGGCQGWAGPPRSCVDRYPGRTWARSGVRHRLDFRDRRS